MPMPRTSSTWWQRTDHAYGLAVHPARIQAMGLDDLAGLIRQRVIRSATSPFGHADYPLSHTLHHRGDPGLFGPGAASWQVIGDVAAFAGGIRALLIQAAHPEVVAGVEDHSRYREDPLGRLSRTSAYVTATTYGALPEVEAAVAAVRGAHRGVSGESPRGKRLPLRTPGTPPGCTTSSPTPSSLPTRHSDRLPCRRVTPTALFENKP